MRVKYGFLPNLSTSVWRSWRNGRLAGVGRLCLDRNCSLSLRRPNSIVSRCQGRFSLSVAWTMMSSIWHMQGWQAGRIWTKPPTAPRALQHKWLPTAPGVCSLLCVCTLDGLKCRAQILSMGNHTWPHVTFTFSL